MLSVLKIRNIAIIESAEIDFSRGFNVLTGETGAGKSIILDSINAVLGFRTSRELIRTGETQAEVTALFSCIGEEVENKLSELGLTSAGDGSLLISRIITADKNICRVNGALINVAVLRELGSSLVSIHGQQDNRDLLDETTHLGYIDSVAEDAEYLAAFTEKYNTFTEINNALKRLSEGREALARKADMLAFQIDELEKAEIKSGEWAELKEKLALIQNFEKIQSSVNNAYAALNGGDGFSGAQELASGAYREIKSIASCSQETEKLSERLGDLYYEIEDLAQTLGGMISDEGYTQAEADYVGSRLDMYRRLSKKYGETEDEMLTFLDNAKKELEEISFSDEHIDELRIKRENAHKQALESASELSGIRRKAAEKFCENVCAELRFLDMPNVKFTADFTVIPLCATGVDGVSFLISANVGEDPKPIAKIASGGELSRIMLALKTVLVGKNSVDTMIFDEIDTGVSGRAAHKVALKLSALSRGRQVLCVTHLAQLASFADNHYLIEKSARGGKTYTEVNLLDFDGRKSEIARITGGGEITAIQLENAAEMLAATEKEKGNI